MDRAHDVLTITFNVPLIWWPRRGARNVFKTCVLSVWLTTLCALRIALTAWDGPVLCKHTDGVTSPENVETFKTNFIVHSQQKLFWQYQWTSLFSIFCRFHVNNGNISQSPCGTHANIWDLSIAVAKQVPRRDWYASAISKLTFSNTNLKIFFLWCMTHLALTKWNMKMTRSKSEWGIQYIFLI